MTDSWTTVGNDPNHYLSYLSPNWGATNNNGNLQGVLEGYGSSVPLISVGWLVQSYGYDTANRLVSVNDTGYTRSFGYDAWGNMWISGYTGIAPVGNPPTTSTGFNTNNQVTTGGAAYDADGNQTVMNGDTVAYDAESRQSSITTAAQAVETYLYDGDGRRVKKVGPNTTIAYVYDALGQLAAEYSTLTSSFPCATCYLSADHLGSTRLVTDSVGNVIARHDFLPFGEEIPANTAGRDSHWGPGNDTVNQKFTGKERDSESGLDYFGARYYGSALGRFTSPDWSEKPEPVPYADLENPQTLNLYTYGHNNPLSQQDPDGHKPCTVDGETHGGVWCFFHSIGLVETQHEQANDLRSFYQGVSYTGSDGKPVEVSQLSDAQIIQFNKDHRASLAASNWSIPGVAAVVPKSALDTLQSVESTGKNLPNQRGGRLTKIEMGNCQRRMRMEIQSRTKSGTRRRRNSKTSSAMMKEWSPAVMGARITHRITMAASRR